MAFWNRKKDEKDVRASKAVDDVASGKTVIVHDMTAKQNVDGTVTATWTSGETETYDNINHKWLEADFWSAIDRNE